MLYKYYAVNMMSGGKIFMTFQRSAIIIGQNLVDK